jgi:CheY-like chemotaxis protein
VTLGTEYEAKFMATIPNASICILIIDPKQASCESILDILCPEGFQCVIAADAPSALRFIRKQPPNLILADIDMPDLTGTEFCQLVREAHSTPEIPVIFFSDTHRAEWPCESRRAGGTYFLSRPFDPAVLLELVDKALWMPHLVRRHIDAEHEMKPKPIHNIRQSERAAR